MLLDCLASCTGCLTPRRVKSAVDTGESAPIVPDPVSEQVAPEAAPGSPQLPAAIDTNGPEPPFQINLGFCTIMGKVEIILVTIDQSMSVNVVTNKCLARLGFKPLQHAMPSKLSELASQAFPGHYGWQKLSLFAPSGHRGLSSNVDFLVVGDDYHCDLLLGYEFKQLTLKPRPGIYPNHSIRPGKGPHINDPFSFSFLDRFGENSKALHADHRLFLQKIGRDRRERGKKGRHEKHRKQPRGNRSTKSSLSS
jgi:hypothetical protein